jgi:hypothetical protein
MNSVPSHNPRIGLYISFGDDLDLFCLWVYTTEPAFVDSLISWDLFAFVAQSARSERVLGCYVFRLFGAIFRVSAVKGTCFTIAVDLSIGSVVG